MTIEVTGIKIEDSVITIDAINLEGILLADDLYADDEPEKLRYEFDRKANGGAQMRYLWKVCQGVKKCQSAKSLGEKIERLVGEVLWLSDNFRTV